MCPVYFTKLYSRGGKGHTAENAYVPLQDGWVASRGVLFMADSDSHPCLGLGGCTGTRKCVVCVSAWLCAPTAVVPVAALLCFLFPLPPVGPRAVASEVG